LSGGVSSGAGFVELIFVFGVGLALGLWELWRVRREIRQTRRREDDKPPDDPQS
jgi:hypothetical protein